MAKKPAKRVAKSASKTAPKKAAKTVGKRAPKKSPKGAAKRAPQKAAKKARGAKAPPGDRARGAKSIKPGGQPKAARASKPVRGSRTGRPIMALFDLLGRRWAMRILWELRDGAQTFREVQARCEGISPSVLNQRMADLREARLVGLREGSGYELTREGTELGHLLLTFNDWSKGWARRRGKK